MTCKQCNSDMRKSDSDRIVSWECPECGAIYKDGTWYNGISESKEKIEYGNE